MLWGCNKSLVWWIIIYYTKPNKHKAKRLGKNGKCQVEQTAELWCNRAKKVAYDWVHTIKVWCVCMHACVCMCVRENLLPETKDLSVQTRIFFPELKVCRRKSRTPPPPQGSQLKWNLYAVITNNLCSFKCRHPWLPWCPLCLVMAPGRLAQCFYVHFTLHPSLKATFFPHEAFGDTLKGTILHGPL